MKSPSPEQHVGVGVPTAYIRRVTMDSSEEGVGVEVQVSLKDVFRGLSKEQASNLTFLKNLVINVYQSRDPSFDARVLSRSTTLRRLVRNKMVEKKTISPFDYIGNEKSTQERQIAKAKDSRGNEYEDFVYTVSFDTKDREPAHLTYFAQAEIDMAAVTKDSGIKTAGPDALLSGKVTGESVIENGQIKRASTLFTIKNNDASEIYQPGAVWAGPVHRHQDGFMTGIVHTKTPHAGLEENQVMNTKILDFRDSKFLEESTFLFDSDQEVEKDLPTELNGDKIKPDRNKDYFSEPFMAQDENGALSLTFSFNHNDYVKNETRFRENATKTGGSDLVGSFPVRNVKIVRHHVETGEQEIVMDASGENVQTADYQWPPASEGQKNRILYGKKPKNNTLETLNILPDNGVITWSLTDNDKEAISGGSHNYEVCLTLEDRTLDEMQRAKDLLEDALSNLASYEELAKTCGAYDAMHDRFTSAFKLRAQKTNWLSSISTFLIVVRRVYGIPPEEFVNNIMALSNPITGTPKGIGHVIRIMQTLSSKIKEVLQGRANPASSRTTKVRTGSGGVGASSRIEVCKLFKDSYDGTKSKSGLFYLNEDLQTKRTPETQNQSTGIKKVDQGVYDSILVKQREKYFVGSSRSSVQNLATGLIGNQAKNVTSFVSEVGKHESVYLTPSKIKSDKRVVETLDKGEELYDLDSYSLITSEMISLNDETAQTKVSKTDSLDNEFALSLSDLMTREGLIIDFDLLDRSSEKSAVDETVGKTTENKEESFIDVLDVLEDDTQLSRKGLQETQKIRYTPREVNERNSLIREVGKEFLSSLATDGGQGRDNLPDDYGFRNSLKKLDPKINKSLVTPNNLRKLGSLPLPILSIIFSRSAATRKNWHDLEIDLTQDGSYTEFYRYNYDMIVKVQYLSGYEPGQASQQLRSPRWLDLTPEVYRGSLVRNSQLFCRLEAYENTELGIGETKSLDVPIYNRYFVLNKSRTTTTLVDPEIETVGAPIEEKFSMLDAMLTPEISDYSRSLTVDHSDMVRAR